MSKIQKRKAIDVLHDIAKRDGIILMCIETRDYGRVKEEVLANMKDYDKIYEMTTKHTRRGDK